MASKLFSIVNRLNSNLRSNPQFSVFTNTISSRSLNTKISSPPSLYSKISPLGTPGTSLVPELDEWVKKGKKVRAAELQRIIRDLRKRKRYTQALEVSEWMGNKGFCTFTSSDHAVQLDLIGRVHGVESAESYFDNLSDQDKTDRTYGALLNCYVRACLTDKSLSHMQKMKDLGFATPLSYNDLMSLYINTEEYEKVPALLKEMKDDGITPNNFSYRICINSYGARADTEGMEKILDEMESQSHIVMDSNTYIVVANIYINAGLTDKAVAALKKAELLMDKKDAILYNHFISMYATLGKKAQVTRFWNLQKQVCKRHINRDYITMLSSLVRLDAFEEAEKVRKEWESSGNCYDFRVPNVLLHGYTKKNLVEKAEAMLEDIVEKGKQTPTPNSWGIVALAYMRKNEMENCLRCMKMALSVRTGRSEGWKPNPNIIYSLLHCIGNKGEVEEVEAFVELLKPAIPMNREMYYALIMANIRAGKEVDELLEKMKADNIDEDEGIKQLLSSRRQENQTD